MAKKPKLKTIQEYNKWNRAKWGLFVGATALPAVPAGVITIVNWDEWYGNSGLSLPFGFASLILTVILAVVAILNSDKIFKKADIALYVSAAIFVSVGLTCWFLASLLYELGTMWIAVGISIIGSGVAVTVENKYVEPNLALYKKLIKENNLDAKSKRDRKREEQARKDAEEDAARQAVE